MNQKILEIIILSPVFPPEPIVSANTSAQIATTLFLHKYSVSVITSFPNRPEGRLYSGYKLKLYWLDKNSVRFSILRCFSIFSKNSSISSRFLENISFGFTSGLALLFSKKPDVIFANSWPIFATGIVRLVATLRKVPLVISIQDVYPESLIAQGRLKVDGFIYRFLIAIDRWIAKGCHTIIPISESFAKLYTDVRNISPDRIKVIPNWVDSKTVIPGSKLEYRRDNDISEDAFVMAYGGNIGMAAGLEKVLEAIKQVKLDREFVFIIAGSGSQMDACRKIASKINNIKVISHSPWQVEDTSKVLSAADVLLLPTSGNQTLVSVPSKMITYMLSSRPILAMALPGSETCSLIQESGCGWVIDPDGSEKFAQKIEEISKITADQFAEMGQAGRDFALSNFVSDVCLPKILEIIENAGKWIPYQ